MKILISAIALIFASPAFAQAPTPAPAQADHSQHGAQHGQHDADHGEHDGHANHAQHGPQHAAGLHSAGHGADCCGDRDGNGRMDCCDQAAAGNRPDCCAGHAAPTPAPASTPTDR